MKGAEEVGGWQEMRGSGNGNVNGQGNFPDESRTKCLLQNNAAIVSENNNNGLQKENVKYLNNTEKGAGINGMEIEINRFGSVALKTF